MFGRRHSVVRRIGAVIVAMLWVQVILAANPACSATSPAFAPTHATEHASGHHATHDAQDQPAQHGPQHCLMSLACSVAVTTAPSTDAVRATPHDLVIPASITAPASVAGALEPPPPRA